jgi:hypothetical protein
MRTVGRKIANRIVAVTLLSEPGKKYSTVTVRNEVYFKYSAGTYVVLEIQFLLTCKFDSLEDHYKVSTST